MQEKEKKKKKRDYDASAGFKPWSPRGAIRGVVVSWRRVVVVSFCDVVGGVVS